MLNGFSRKFHRTLFKIFYGITYDAILAFGLVLTFLELQNFILGSEDKNDEDILEDKQSLIALWIYFGIGLVASLPNTFYMLRNAKEMMTGNFFPEKIRKFDIAKLIFSAIPAVICGAGAYEFVRLQGGNSYFVIACGGSGFLLAIPGEIFTYGKNLFDESKCSFTVINRVFTHPNLTSKKLKALYGLRIFGQTSSTIADNLPEIPAFKVILKKLFPKLLALGIGIGLPVTLVLAAAEANNELSAIFDEIHEQLDEQGSISERTSLRINDVKSVLNKNKTNKEYYCCASLPKLLVGASAVVYALSAGLFSTLIVNPYDQENGGNYYWIWNSLILLAPISTIGAMSCIGQCKVVSKATDHVFTKGNRYSFFAAANAQQPELDMSSDIIAIPNSNLEMTYNC